MGRSKKNSEKEKDVVKVTPKAKNTTETRVQGKKSAPTQPAPIQAVPSKRVFEDLATTKTTEKQRFVIPGVKKSSSAPVVKKTRLTQEDVANAVATAQREIVKAQEKKELQEFLEEEEQELQGGRSRAEEEEPEPTEEEEAEATEEEMEKMLQKTTAILGEDSEEVGEMPEEEESTTTEIVVESKKKQIQKNSKGKKPTLSKKKSSKVVVDSDSEE